MPEICASLMESTVKGFLKTAKEVEADLLEVRADGLSECTQENVHHLLTELKKTTDARIILTVRNKGEGGYFEGTEEDRKKTILGSLHLTDLVDIELRSEIRDEIISKAKANKIEVIVSFHDFDKTPSKNEIIGLIEEEIRAGADYAKVAFHTATTRDVLELLKVTEELSKKTRVIAISMGELGIISRVAAPLFGSALTYASPGKKTAPGQLSVEDTKKIFEILGV